MRDLFGDESAGWLTDPALLDRLVTEKLEQAAVATRAEGWKWAEIILELTWEALKNFVSLSETLYGWLSETNRVMLMPDGRRSHTAVGCTDQLLVPALVHAGRTEEADHAFKQMMEYYPALTVSKVRNALPFVPDMVERIIGGLRQIGLAE